MGAACAAPCQAEGARRLAPSGRAMLHLNLAIIEERRGVAPSQSRGKGASAAVLPMLAMLNQANPRKRGALRFRLVCAWLRVGPRGLMTTPPTLAEGQAVRPFQGLTATPNWALLLKRRSPRS